MLGATLTGSATTSLLIGRFGDRVGRRRCYSILFLLLAVVGVVFAFADSVYVLTIVGLTGALSTEVIESGPFTSLEQAMLATDADVRSRTVRFGRYNAVAAASGSFGALAVGLLGYLAAGRQHIVSQRWFLIFVPVAIAGSLVALSLSPRAETQTVRGRAARLEKSRHTVHRLSILFALDSFAGGLTVSVFVGFWLHVRFHATTGTIGVLFFLFGVLQMVSFLVAPVLANRFGLLRTMVFTHLPSDLLVVSVAFAPTLAVAVALLVARTCLSQMDVPTRQTYVMTLVSPEERTPAAAYTNTARYVTRPAGPPLAGILMQTAQGLPFLISGLLKVAYDLTLWNWFRRIPLPSETSDSEFGESPD